MKINTDEEKYSAYRSYSHSERSMTYAYMKAKEASVLRSELSDARAKHDQLQKEAERLAKASMQMAAEAKRKEALVLGYKEQLLNVN